MVLRSVAAFFALLFAALGVVMGWFVYYAVRERSYLPGLTMISFGLCFLFMVYRFGTLVFRRQAERTPAE